MMVINSYTETTQFTMSTSPRLHLAAFVTNVIASRLIYHLIKWLFIVIDLNSVISFATFVVQ